MYFHAYGLLPQLLFQGQRGVDLFTEALALHGVSAEREHKSYGKAAGVAGDDGGIVFEKGLKDAGGDGDLFVVDDYDADVFHGDGAVGLLLRCRAFGGVLFVFGEADEHLSVAQAEVGGIAKAQCLLYHSILGYKKSKELRVQTLLRD